MLITPRSRISILQIATDRSRSSDLYLSRLRFFRYWNCSPPVLRTSSTLRRPRILCARQLWCPTMAEFTRNKSFSPPLVKIRSSSPCFHRRVGLSLLRLAPQVCWDYAKTSTVFCRTSRPESFEKIQPFSSTRSPTPSCSSSAPRTVTRPPIDR
jgi:hypothetical protein